MRKFLFFLSFACLIPLFTHAQNSVAREVAGFGQKNLAVETTAASEINSDLSSIKPSSVVYTDNTKDGWITWAGESVYHLFGMGAVQAGIYAVPGGGCNDVVITVGEGTTGTYYLPCNTFYKYSYVQQIYTADEMEVSDAGQISTVAFQYIYSTAQTKNPVSIYMGNTDKENFTSNTDWVSVGDMQLVYSGSVTFDNTGTDNWVTITFDTPFDYEGGNVVVAFLNNNGAYTTGSNNTFYCHTNPGNRVLYYRVDGSSPINPATPPSASSYTYGYRNNIKFDACLSSAPILCPKPDDILVSNIGENSAEISWTETGSATEWNIELLLEGQVQGEGTIYSVSNTPSFTLTELDPNTDYTVYVQANCGGSNGTSEWKGPKSFTTLCSAFYLPFSEGFEAGEFSNCWSQEYVSGTHAWIVRTNASNPSAPHSGNYNAAYAHSSTGSKTKLVSPKFDLSGNANANMLFWHAQKAWTGDQDELRVYYKNAPDGEWTMIAEYTESIPEWTQEAITLPNLTSTYWIAFEGLDDYGYGVVLDDIYIYEPVYTQIAGNVTYLGNGVAGAEVYLDGEIMDYTATTDANGLYTMLIEAATYTVTASAEGYNETVIEGYEAVSPICLLNIELTAPILAITPAEIVVRTTYGTDGYAAVRLTNEGNGPGSWRMVKDYLDKSINNINGVTISNTPNNISYPAAVDGSPYTSIIEGGNNSKAAWDLVNSFTATAGGMQGVATDGEYVYLTSWQASPTAGWSFEKYDLDLNFVEGFSISGVAQLRDLTYDGTYFYGGSGSTLYCLDLANQTLVSSVSTGVGTIRHCTYDPANDGFWVGNWTDLYLINRAGTVQFTGPAPASAYGSGYDYITEGGPYLLLFCQPNSNAVVYQYDIANNVITGQIFDFASMPGYNAGISGGAFVGAYGDKVCFFGNLQQAPNLIGIYELGDVPVDGWLSSEITSGTLEAGESVDILFRMDGLWAEEGEFHANVYFNPTPNSGAVVLPVTFIIGPSACPMPIDLTAELKGQYLYEDLNDVVLHWGIEASGSGTLEPVLEETFEAGAIPDGWTILDEDGDGYFWNAEYGYGLFVGHTGECISSASYINYAGALTPDNWLITPQIALDGGNVNYWVNAQDASYAYEHYGVYISTTGTDPDDFTLLFEETMTAKGDKYVGERGSRDQGAWYERTIDLTGITGNVYIAFRHFNCTDAFWLNLDDVIVSTYVGGKGVIATPAPEYTRPTGEVPAADLVTLPDPKPAASNVIPVPYVHAKTGDEIINEATMITHVGAGANGADVSALWGSETTLGPNANNVLNYYLADDFSLTAQTTINQLEFYAYQTGAGSTSTLTGLFVTIYNGSPAAGGEVVWGDQTTNILTSTSFTNIYRTNSTDLTATNRAIMKAVADVEIILPTGDYWFVVSFTGSASSGPWGARTEVLDVVNTGNAMQYTSTGWTNLTDSGSSGTYGVPFIVRGTQGNSSLLGFNIYRNGFLINEEPYLGFTYTDEDLPWESNNCYAVEAVYTNGCISNRTDRVCIDIPADPCTPKTIPYAESFENSGYIPMCWSQETTTGNMPWIFVQSSYYGLPDAASDGEYFANFPDVTSASYATKLVSPQFDFTGYEQVAVTFDLFQEDWSGDQTSLNLYYKNSADGEWIPIASINESISEWTEFKYELPNISSTYWFAFEGVAGFGYGSAIDNVKVDIYCNPVLDLTANVNERVVTLNWTPNPFVPGGKEGDVTLIEEAFEANTIPEGWTLVDADGDGYNWDATSGYGLFVGHSGECISSASYINYIGALTPDNWLVTPQLQILGGTVNYWISAQDASWASEHYGVYISTTGTDPDDFTLLFEETMTAKGDKYAGERGTRTQGAWYEKTIDLTGYTGNVYIAFRHFNCSDCFWLNLDDVTVTTPAMDYSCNVYRDGELIGSTSLPTYTDSGLDNGTYTYCIEPVYPNGCTADQVCVDATVFFFDAPTDLILSTEYNVQAVEMSWTAPTQTDLLGYNIYRDGVMINENIVTETEYTDEDVEFITYYCYDVTAVYSIEGGTIESDPVSDCINTPCFVYSYPYVEDFEDPNEDQCWSQEYLIGSTSWTYANAPAYYNSNHSGNRCLRFYSYYASSRLISPEIDLTESEMPILRFWHAQRTWAGDQDQLKVYYRTSDDSEWILLAEYTNSIYTWTEEEITLPEISANFRLAFDGIGRWGHGIVLDDVSITDWEYTECGLPARNLAVEVEEQDVTFTWENPFGNEMRYHGNEFEGFAFNGGNNPVWLATAFSATDLADCPAMTLDHVGFVPYFLEDIVSDNYTVLIYTAEPNSSELTLVNSFDVDDLIANIYNYVTLPEPMTIDPTKDLYIGIKLPDYYSGIWRTSTDYVNGWTNLISFDGVSYPETFQTSNWAITGYVTFTEGGKSSHTSLTQLTAKPRTLAEAPEGALKSADDILHPIVVEQYAVYADNMFVGYTSDPIWYFTDQAYGYHDYCVRVVYEDCVSPIACIQATICEPIFDLTAVYDRDLRETYLSWTAPQVFAVSVYNVYRSDIGYIGQTIFPYYTDSNVGFGEFTYCVVPEYIRVECTPAERCVTITACGDPVLDMTLTQGINDIKTVEIAWTAPETIYPYTGYNIYRDGTLLATTTETSYVDADAELEFNMEYVYGVAPQYDGCEELLEAAITLEIQAPISANVVRTDNEYVLILNWVAPAQEIRTGFNVYNNTELVATVAPEVTAYQFELPAGTYDLCAASVYGAYVSELTCAETVTVLNLSTCNPVANLESVVDNCSVTLYWDAPEVNYNTILSYTILRDGVEIATTTNTEFNESIAESGTYNYCIAVNYEDQTNCTGENACIDVVVDLGTIENLIVEAENTQVKLVWTAIEDAEYYEITTDGEFLAQVITNEYTYTVNAEGLYEYAVTAVYENGCTSVSAIATVLVDVEEVTDVVAEVQNDNYTVEVTWNMPQPNTNLTGYKIYRDGELLMVLDDISVLNYVDVPEASGSIMYCVKAFYNNVYAESVCDVATLNYNLQYPTVLDLYEEGKDNLTSVIGWVPGSERATAYNVYMTVDGQDQLLTTVTVEAYMHKFEYETAAQEFGVSAMYGEYESAISHITINDVIVNPVPGFAGTGDLGAVTLTWEAPSDIYNDLIGYQLYREGEIIGSTAPGTLTFVDYPELGLAYDYCIKALYGPNAVESDQRCIFDVDPMFCEAPSNLFAQVIGANKVELTWDAPAHVADPSYNVYRQGLLIAVVEEPYYLDTDNLPSGFYTYSVSTVCATSDNGESVRIDFAINVVAAIEDIDVVDVNIYPNPAREYVMIESENMTKVVVFNNNGQLMRNIDLNRENSTRIDVREFASGVYFVEIVNADGQKTQNRFVVE